MDEADSATKTLGLNEPPLGMPTVEGSDTESEAEVTTMAVMAEPGNIDIGAESLPNTDEAEAAFAGKAALTDDRAFSVERAGKCTIRLEQNCSKFYQLCSWKSFI